MKPKHGQHFLIDQRVLNRIIGYAGLTETDTVLEIGGGTGNLTLKLKEVAGKVIVIELDRRLAAGLEHITRDSNVTVLQGDALQIPLPGFNKVVANLPYQISSKITFRLLRHSFDLAVLMYQLEFAKRMLASPGTPDYSRLSVMTQYFARIELLETVTPSAFKPQPAVRSAILKLTPREPPYNVKDIGFFEKFLKAVFGQRRKMLRNSLRTAAQILEIPPENLSKVDQGILEMRPGSLTPEELAELANRIQAGT
jgi:16S rRNA (adenine1518-N6/adenine1519-N6)-dimethyltransferase